MNLRTVSDYILERLNFIKRLEGERSDAYTDSVGIPTIGYGFNLQVSTNLDAVLRAFGFDVDSSVLTGQALTAEQEYIASIRTQVNALYSSGATGSTTLNSILNSIMSSRVADTRYSDVPATFVRRATFEFNSADTDRNGYVDEIESTYNAIISDYETILDNWLNATGASTSNPDLLIHNNKERIVLLHFDNKVRHRVMRNFVGILQSLAPFIFYQTSNMEYQL